MSRYYAAREIMGARIYDILGLYYGEFTGLRVEPDDVYIMASIRASAREPVIDVDNLSRLLRERGYDADNEPVEVLVGIARREGIDIPYKVAEREEVLLKGLIPSREVAIIDYRRDVMGGIAVILLSTDREARFRGLEGVSRANRVPREEDVRGKLVISIERGILGVAYGYVIGPGGAGIRAVAGGSSEEYINWLGFLNQVKRVDKKLYNRLADEVNPLKHPRVGIEEIEGLMDMIRGAGLEELLSRYRETKPSRHGGYIDIPLSSLRSVGDAIVVG